MPPSDRPADVAAAAAARLTRLALALTVPVLLVTLDVLVSGPLRHLDALLAWQPWHAGDPLLVSVADVFDRLGQRAVAGTALVAVAGLLAWRRRSWRPLFVTGAGLVVLNVVVGSMKVGLGRTRPVTGHDLLFTGDSQFPSGHAANAVLTWGLLAWLIARYGRTRLPTRVLAWAVALVSAGVAASSFYLGYHWLTDLVAGTFCGAALLALTVAWDLRADQRELDRAVERELRELLGRPLPSGALVHGLVLG